MPLPQTTPAASELAAELFPSVFRASLDAPGFALVPLPEATTPVHTRRLMLDLAEELSALHRARDGRELLVLSAVRFDQQVTTRFHLDGGPDESYLLLGYEPSTVASELAVADLARAAQDAGLEPSEYLDAHSPLLPDGERRLAKYVTRLDGFEPSRRAHLLLVNNGRSGWGVLHRGNIPAPDPSRERVINSMMLAPTGEGIVAAPGAQVAEFLSGV